MSGDIHIPRTTAIAEYLAFSKVERFAKWMDSPVRRTEFASAYGFAESTVMDFVAKIRQPKEEAASASAAARERKRRFPPGTWVRWPEWLATQVDGERDFGFTEADTHAVEETDAWDRLRNRYTRSMGVLYLPSMHAGDSAVAKIDVIQKTTTGRAVVLTIEGSYWEDSAADVGGGIFVGHASRTPDLVGATIAQATSSDNWAGWGRMRVADVPGVEVLSAMNAAQLISEPESKAVTIQLAQLTSEERFIKSITQLTSVDRATARAMGSVYRQREWRLATGFVQKGEDVRVTRFGLFGMPSDVSSFLVAMIRAVVIQMPDEMEAFLDRPPGIHVGRKLTLAEFKAALVKIGVWVFAAHWMIYSTTPDMIGLDFEQLEADYPLPPGVIGSSTGDPRKLYDDLCRRGVSTDAYMAALQRVVIRADLGLRVLYWGFGKK